MKKYAFYLLLIVSISACEKEVPNARLPEDVVKLVVGCFISPQDTVLEATVTLSVPTTGYRRDPSQTVQDATVTLATGSRSTTLVFDATRNAYLADAKNFPIVAGETYTLRVTTPTGYQAEATCTVPITPYIPLEVSFDTVTSRYWDGKEYIMRISWQDLAGESNYYRAAGEIKSTYSQTGIPNNSPFREAYWETSGLVSDQSRDGQRLTSPRGVFYGMPSGEPSSVELYAYLLHTDNHYYRYHQSFSNAQYSQDNPFAEPALVYTNVTGGLGIFAAYTRTTAVVKLK